MWTKSLYPKPSPGTVRRRRRIALLVAGVAVLALVTAARWALVRTEEAVRGIGQGVAQAIAQLSSRIETVALPAASGLRVRRAGRATGLGHRPGGFG
jgi:hypothetical protein